MFLDEGWEGNTDRGRRREVMLFILALCHGGIYVTEMIVYTARRSLWAPMITNTTRHYKRTFLLKIISGILLFLTLLIVKLFAIFCLSLHGHNTYAFYNVSFNVLNVLRDCLHRNYFYFLNT